MKRFGLPCLAALLLAGCAQQTVRDTPMAVPAIAASDVATQLDALYAEYWEEALKRSPLRATAIGDARYHGELTNTQSAAYRSESERLDRAWLERVRAIDPASLDRSQRLSYNMFIAARERSLAMARHPEWMLAVSPLGHVAATVAQLGAGSRGQPFVTVQDYDNWLRRGDAFVALFDQSIDNLRAGIAAGVVLPRVLVEKTLPQFDALIKDKPEDTVLWGVVARMPETFTAAARTIDDGLSRADRRAPAARIRAPARFPARRISACSAHQRGSRRVAEWQCLVCGSREALHHDGSDAATDSPDRSR